MINHIENQSLCLHDVCVLCMIILHACVCVFVNYTLITHTDIMQTQIFIFDAINHN